MLIDTDTDSIRAALLVRLTDDHPDVRVEAIAGLARRGSESVIPALKNELSIAFAATLFDAASDLADPALCEALTAARGAARLWPDHVRISWQEALAACGCEPQPDLQDPNGNGS